MRFSLAWSMKGSGGNTRIVSIELIREHIAKVIESSGSVVLERLDIEEGLISLQLLCDGGSCNSFSIEYRRRMSLYR